MIARVSTSSFHLYFMILYYLSCTRILICSFHLLLLIILVLICLSPYLWPSGSRTRFSGVGFSVGRHFPTPNKIFLSVGKFFLCRKYFSECRKIFPVWNYLVRRRTQSCSASNTGRTEYSHRCRNGVRTLLPNPKI